MFPMISGLFLESVKVETTQMSLSSIKLPSQNFHDSPIPKQSMVYLPTFAIKNQPNVGTYTIHGW